LYRHLLISVFGRLVTGEAEVVSGTVVSAVLFICSPQPDNAVTAIAAIISADKIDIAFIIKNS
jgi:hypothetical protein